MKLMIVESPGKIKKLESFLGNDWKVVASVGHIRDLPEERMGFDTSTFIPEYEVYPDKENVVANLKKFAALSDDIYLATDLDREGEAIAFHIKEVLKLKNPKRIVFNKITKAAVLEAISNARGIDYKKVEEQEARRVLDRIVGYLVSPILSKLSGIKLSAGRVQSPAVKLAVLRERDIRKFIKQNFYNIKITTSNGITASLDVKQWCDDGKHIFDKPLADKIAQCGRVTVTKAITEDKYTKPRPPFTTASLQQAASSALKINITKCMELAQKLYEQGAITYHRTDSPNLSSEGFAEVCNFLRSKNYGHQDEQIVWQGSESAQEAHEAIRASHIEEIDCGDTVAEKKLYSLIRERTLTSAMKPAIDTVTTLEFISEESFEYNGSVSQAKFIATGRVVKSPGWRELAVLEAPTKSDDVLAATASVNETFKVTSSVQVKTTEPPPRYNEASLVNALEKLGIGRPSTYASIMETNKEREYLIIGDGSKSKKDISIRPTSKGEHLFDAINFMTFMNLDYTRLLEVELDNIATGKRDYFSVVQSVYAVVSKEIHSIQMQKLIPTAICPQCDKELKRLESKKKSGQFFWVHIDNDHECDDFINDENGNPVQKKERVG